MRIDMRIVLKPGEFGNHEFGYDNGHLWINMTNEQARALRDAITKQLRGASRDKNEAAER